MFQFTHPGKGATNSTVADRYNDFVVSIHAPWEGCDSPRPPTPRARRSFNSRTLGRVRRAATINYLNELRFNSRTLGRVRPSTSSVLAMIRKVSIHAPWEGCDRRRSRPYSTDASFNSRTLGRVRREAQKNAVRRLWFQFTHPGKGATASSSTTTRCMQRFNSRTLGRVRHASRACPRSVS